MATSADTWYPTWSEDGNLIIGVRHQAFVSQAFALEYGDATRPPAPLFRTLGTEQDKASEVFQAEMADRVSRPDPLPLASYR